MAVPMSDPGPAGHLGTWGMGQWYGKTPSLLCTESYKAPSHHSLPSSHVRLHHSHVLREILVHWGLGRASHMLPGLRNSLLGPPSGLLWASCGSGFMFYLQPQAWLQQSPLALRSNPWLSLGVLPASLGLFLCCVPLGGQGAPGWGRDMVPDD